MTKYGLLTSKGIEIVPQGTSDAFPLVETPPPDSIEQGTKAVAHYEQRGSQIVKVWELVPWTEQDWENARAAEAEAAEAETEAET